MKQDLNNHCKYFKANRFQGMIKKFRDLMIKYITFAPPPRFQQDNLALTGLFLLLFQITLLHQSVSIICSKFV